MPIKSPDDMHRAFEAAFNTRGMDALLALYEPDAMLIPQPGIVVHGRDQIRAALQGFLTLEAKGWKGAAGTALIQGPSCGALPRRRLG